MSRNSSVTINKVNFVYFLLIDCKIGLNSLLKLLKYLNLFQGNLRFLFTAWKHHKTKGCYIGREEDVTLIKRNYNAKQSWLMTTSKWPISFVNNLSMAKPLKISAAAFYLELHDPQYPPVFSVLDFSVAHPTGSFLFTIQSRCIWSFMVINIKTFYQCLVVKVYCWGKLVLTCLVMSLKVH